MTECIDHGKRGTGKGYLQRKVKGSMRYAHRLAYAAAHGLDEATLGGVVRHTCDNSRCINPAHLILGTTQDNVDDRVARARSCSGPAHHSHKLTDAQVQEASALYVPRHPVYGLRAMARSLGVTHASLSEAINRKEAT